VVTNHVHFLDWLLLVGRHYFCTFVMRSDFKKMPVMGTATNTMQCFYVSRTATEEENNKLVASLTQRMKDVENGVYERPVWIAAESICANGSGLIPFKRGAFDSLCAVQPCVFRYDLIFRGISQAYDVTTLEGQFMLWTSKIVSDVTIFSLPLFIPNDYLFEKYAHKGETKADVF